MREATHMECPSTPSVHLLDRHQLLITAKRHSSWCWDRNLLVFLQQNVSERIHEELNKRTPRSDRSVPIGIAIF